MDVCNFKHIKYLLKYIFLFFIYYLYVFYKIVYNECDHLPSIGELLPPAPVNTHGFLTLFWRHGELDYRSPESSDDLPSSGELVYWLPESSDHLPAIQELVYRLPESSDHLPTHHRRASLPITRE